MVRKGFLIFLLGICYRNTILLGSNTFQMGVSLIAFSIIYICNSYSNLSRLGVIVSVITSIIESVLRRDKILDTYPKEEEEQQQ